MTPDEILDRAADEVSKPDGWQQRRLGWFMDRDSPVCAMGAILRATRDVHGQQHEAVRALFWEIGEGSVSADAALVGVVRWNDHPDRTQDEVAEAMRRAAKSYREKTQREGV